MGRVSRENLKNIIIYYVQSVPRELADLKRPGNRVYIIIRAALN